jgi:REP element-mobilizing transposase RayT
VARTPRSALPDGIYHVFSRGVGGANLFGDNDDRRLFLNLLSRVIARWEWDCYAFCLMDTHYHVVLETPRVMLSLGAHYLTGRYAKAFNARYTRYGHLFADRFGVRVVEDEQYLTEVCSYVVNNPVRAGLCATAADWPWSACCYGLDI